MTRGRWIFPNDLYLKFYEPESEDAEYYYEAILNSTYMKPLLTHIKMTESGSVEKRMFEIGIPKFNAKDKVHIRLVKLVKSHESRLGTTLKNSDYRVKNEAVYGKDKYAKQIEELMEKMFERHRKRYMLLHSGWYSEEEKRLAQIL